MTTYRVILDSETRPKQVAARLDHLPSMAVDAPDVDTAARLAVAHHIDNRPPPPPTGTSFALIVIHRRGTDAHEPHGSSDQKIGGAAVLLDEAGSCRRAGKHRAAAARADRTPRRRTAGLDGRRTVHPHNPPPALNQRPRGTLTRLPNAEVDWRSDGPPTRPRRPSTTRLARLPRRRAARAGDSVPRRPRRRLTTGARPPSPPYRSTPKSVPARSPSSTTP